jgi:hypothetical protein
MKSPVALVLLGLWFGLVVGSWVMASASFRTAEGFGARPLVAQRVASVQEADLRMVFRSMAAEWNRFMFRTRSQVEIMVGLALVALLWRGGTSAKVAGAALLLVLVQGLWLGPAMEAFGRPLDFAPRPLAPDLGRHFGLLHGAYLLLDLGKALLLVLLASLLGRSL